MFSTLSGGFARVLTILAVSWAVSCGRVDAAEAPGASGWSAEFVSPVFGGEIFPAVATAVAVTADGAYVGGSFNRIGAVLAGAGSLAANGIARWDGRVWHALGSGLENFLNPLFDGTVHAIAVDGTDVYVGGTFTTAGGEPASRIARWDGTRWWPLGPGLNGAVQSITIHGGQVYVGGSFSAAGDVPLLGIGRWDGAGWSPIGSGLAANFRIRAIAVHDGRIYAGGNFFVIQAGGTLIRSIAEWDGEQWSPVGSGVNMEVNALAVYGGNLMAAGNFTTAGNVPANLIARWDGAAWSPLGSGLGGGLFPAANTLVVHEGALVAGGTFTTAGEVPVTGLARWNGTDWGAYADPLNTSIGVVGTVAALAAGSAGVYAVGNFSEAGSSTVPGLALWDGGQWSAMGSGVAGSVQAAVSTPEGTYVGGQFPTAGGVRVNSITVRRGGAWHPLGGGVQALGQPGLIRAIATHGSQVYVGGSFSVAGGVATTNVARWDGATWSALGGGLFGGPGAGVLSLAVAPNGDLVAGGAFNQAGGQAVRNIARWNGSEWSALGEGLVAPGGGTVQALAFLGDALFAGGAFNQPVPFLARWDGAAWTTPGGAPDATVLGLSVHDGRLYAGGYFQRIGGLTVNRIASWDGTMWAPLASGVGTDSMQEYVAVVNASAAGVFAGGVFTNAGPVATRRIARFDGTEWSPLGSGITAGPIGTDPFVYGLAVEDGALQVGGAFAEAGGLPASSYSTWRFAVTPTAPSLSVTLSPSGLLVLAWNATAGSRYQLMATGALGEAFAPLGEPRTATGPVLEATVPVAEVSGQWYRVDLLP
ncbi:MAG: hypothetical protein KF791_15445 [Verrucomicrobiae bacterium]|nr:hypothetical protein [Verrucomicrobiae bacterium]